MPRPDDCLPGGSAILHVGVQNSRRLALWRTARERGAWLRSLRRADTHALPSAVAYAAAAMADRCGTRPSLILVSPTASVSEI